MKIGSFVRVANLDELKVAGPFAVSANGIDVVVVRTRSGLRAFEGRCPHQGALLGEGEIEGDRLVCRNHRWRFKLDSGAATGDPNASPRVPSTRETAPSSSTFRRFPAERKRRGRRGRWTICPGQKGCHCWATSTSSTCRSCISSSRLGRRDMARLIYSEWGGVRRSRSPIRPGAKRVCERGRIPFGATPAWPR